MERVIRGVPAAPGVAVGLARLLGPPSEALPQAIMPGARKAEALKAAAAMREAAEQLEKVAARLGHEGRPEEAEIVATGVLMAGDPVLEQAIEELILNEGLPAATAILSATETQALSIASLDDPNLAARAADVRSVGRRAALVISGGPQPRSASGSAESDVILVADDLGPADVAELAPDVVGLALANGGVSAHAAIVARSLGIPLVIGFDQAASPVRQGATAIIDGSRGELIVEPSAPRLEAARRSIEMAGRARARSRANRELPAKTLDGRSIRVLANASSVSELALALEAGADGIGLLRTELAFLEARGWPTLEQHRALLQPLFQRLGRRVATVRLLDFGGDKTPPFLKGIAGRGIQILLREPRALTTQLEAILEAPGEVQLRILVPMVTGANDIFPIREQVNELARRRRVRPPQVGAMIEVPAAAELADQLAPLVDFFSIGTNDLTQYTLGLDRAGAREAAPHHPAVLRLIASTVSAAHSARILVDVCGEAASQPIGMPLLLGLGVDELSVGTARLGVVRNWVRSLDYRTLHELAQRSLECSSAADVEGLMRAQSELLEGVERGTESVQGGVGVLPFSAQS